MKEPCNATAFSSKDEEVIVWTDEGDEIPIKVPRYRLRALIASCLDALEGKDSNR